MRYLIVFLCLPFFYQSYAQNAEKKSQNVVSVQLAGTGGDYLSLRYERVLMTKDKWLMAQAVGYAPSFGINGLNTRAWFTEVNWVFGSGKHHFETGLSYSMVKPNQSFNFSWLSNTTGFSFLDIGYRFQDFSKPGMSFGFMVSPLLLEGGYLGPYTWGGVSLGYSF